MLWFNLAEDRGLAHIDAVAKGFKKQHKPSLKSAGTNLRGMGAMVSGFEVCHLNGLRKMWAIMSGKTLVCDNKTRTYTPELERARK